MASITENRIFEEVHPWDWHIPAEATKLLIGAFPTHESNRKYDFFYCSFNNRLWEVLCSLADHSLVRLNTTDGISERMIVLEKLKLGLTDMGKRVLRHQSSSNDHSLFPIEFIDIIQILTDNPAIDTLVFSGDGEKNSSLSWFSIYCSLNDIHIDFKELEKEKGKPHEITIAGRILKLYIGYSTSRRSRSSTSFLVNSYQFLK